MKRQKIRKGILIMSLLFFPVTLYYFSPALIISAGLQGIITGSFFVFMVQFVLSIPFGRVFCAWFCPAGALQECAFSVNDGRPGHRFGNVIKYVIWVIWLAGVIYCYFHGKETLEADFFFETEHGISVSSIQSYVIYYGILCLILIPALLFGKRAFCHYFCWMAPFMALGMKLRGILHLPGLHIQVRDKAQCVSCGKCSKECPMSLPVQEMVQAGHIGNAECIQCGSCIDGCPHHILGYGMRSQNHGDGEKT